MKLITDTQLNELLIRQYSDKVQEYIDRRNERIKNAFAAFMGPEFSVRPKHSLQLLNERLTRYQEIYQTNQANIMLIKIQEIQNRIASEDYAKENTPEFEYRTNYMEKAKEFVWPDQNESAIRQQEEQELIAFLNSQQ